MQDKRLLEIVEQLNVAVLILDRNMKISYINEKGKECYQKLNGISVETGYDTKAIHSPRNIQNIISLFEEFDRGKSVSYMTMKSDLFDSGQLGIVYIPVIEEEKVTGILEVFLPTDFNLEDGYGLYKSANSEEK